jgi:PKD repeat protein
MKTQNSLFFIACSIIIFSACQDDNNKETAIACFQFNADTAEVGETVQFTNCSENAEDYYWLFGDAGSSTQFEPGHSYGQAGTYTVKLYAGKDYNADGILDDKDDPDSVVKTIVIKTHIKSLELTVVDITGWSPENPVPEPVQGATVKLFTNEASLNANTPEYEFTSNKNGIVEAYDMPQGEYLLVATTANLGNTIHGYLIAGVFQNQEEIDSWPSQSGAAIGYPKFTDINADLIIDDSDRVTSDHISVTAEETTTKTIYLGK